RGCEVVECGEEELSGIIKDLSGVNVKSFDSDLSSIRGEGVMIFKLEDGFDKGLDE
ncbi:Na-translocating system protein MpsC family protein, partial [Staphylococcus epidermidis]|uniref:Na-translocating system protein MpsC family protein n=1 Tax=Staphylococcus epidermidis TaxID=1282 RepID=UPI0011A5F6DD